MLKHKFIFTKTIAVIIILFFTACTGTRQYYNLALTFENNGNIKDAAKNYLISLERKPSNKKAKIKVLSIGQKYLDKLSSDFFREYNSQQYETCIETYTEFTKYRTKAKTLTIELIYPPIYDKDYLEALRLYSEINYNKVLKFIKEEQYENALLLAKKIEKLNPNYKNIREIENISYCEPLYRDAIKLFKNKKNNLAKNNLQLIQQKSENYKQSSSLLKLINDLLFVRYMIFYPKNSYAESVYVNILNWSNQHSDKFELITNTPFSNFEVSPSSINSTSKELLKTIHLATGIDFYLTFNTTNVFEYESQLTAIEKTGYETHYREKYEADNKTKYKEYYTKPFKYFEKYANESVEFDLEYNIINASTGKVFTSFKQHYIAKDEINYNELASGYSGVSITNSSENNEVKSSSGSFWLSLLNIIFNSWQKKFNATKTLKPITTLKNDLLNNTHNKIIESLNIHLKKNDND